MRIRCFATAALSVLAVAGCASFSNTADTAVHAGMLRSDLKAHFGEPLRIVPAADGGEDWYYPFSVWKNGPAGSTGTPDEFGEKTSYAFVGWRFSNHTEEEPIHVSAAGCVTGPLPRGKVVKQ